MIIIANYAYIRVSSTDQNESRQLDAIADLNIPKENVYIDKQSGKDFERPQYKELIEHLQPDDLLYIKSIDRLGRGYDAILEQWRVITKEIKADISVLDMPLLDTRCDKNLIGTLIADIVLQLLSFVAQNERENIKTRQAEGIAAAKSRGKHLGRPTKKKPKNFANLAKRWESKEISLQKVLDECGGVCASTFYSWLREYRSERGS